MPEIRADLVDAYIFRRGAAGVEFLQMRRARGLGAGDWHPVMGHAQRGETAIDCARREVREETGLDVSRPPCVGGWALEQVHPFYLPEADAIVMSPRFAFEVEPAWTPSLSDEHDAWRWTPAESIGAAFAWPGQRAACREILRDVVGGDDDARRRRSIRR